MINFCNGFFQRKSLTNAINYGTALKSPDNLRLSNYDSRAQTFFHELTHLDLAADSPEPNPRVDDLTIAIKYGSGNTQRTLNTVAYGPLRTKILARYQKDTGKYVQQNGMYMIFSNYALFTVLIDLLADNLAYFALAKYVMTKNNNLYPHLPIVINEIDGPPWIAPSGTVAEFITNGNTAYLNASAADLDDPALNDYAEAEDDLPGCPDKYA